MDDRKFSRIFFESGRKMDSELWALVMDYWRKLTEKKPCIHVTNQQTVRELDKLGYVSPVLLPDVMLREFWKGK